MYELRVTIELLNERGDSVDSSVVLVDVGSDSMIGDIETEIDMLTERCEEDI